ncbi:MAG TPA: protein kinase [Candidatus Polarisedimenticolaceae bacterium]|nr:protein kinase [Candidatus Polarisedimenticolaceae bacterium]
MEPHRDPQGHLGQDRGQASLKSRRLSHYRIERRLGAGGMGEVWLAEDLALGRPAALKLLPQGFQPELRRRLLREAEASGRLQHPAIATFFESGEHEGIAFIAMEYVAGQSLRVRLAQGRFTEEDATVIASALLEALGHAHAAGVLHRDLKPENVLLSGARGVKLLDFGLARHLIADQGLSHTHTALTEAGAVVGTFGYMAPEQLSGGAVDARTDLFALGAVLYEMLSGTPAFPGETVAARIAATLSREPEPIAGVGPGLHAVLRRALARDPSDRYPDAVSFQRDLRDARSGVAVAALPDSLAILDFDLRSSDPADAWIGTGVAESLAADLGRLTGVKVLPRPRVQGARSAAGEGADPHRVGLLLGCRWIVSGSIQKLGDRLRLVAQLLEVGTGRVAASEKVDGALDDLFAMQDRLAERLGTDFGEKGHAPLEAPVPRLDAYACWAKGRGEWLRMAKGGFERAEEWFAAAVAAEPDYARAHVGLAMVHDMRFTFTTDPAELRRAEEHARRALAAAPEDPEAHVWLAYALWRQGDLRSAEELLARGAVLDPANGYPPYFLACIATEQARHADAVPLFQRAVANMPPFGFAWLGLANAHVATGALEEAAWCFERTLRLERDGKHATAGAGGYYAELLRLRGALPEARAACLQALAFAEGSDHMYRDSFRALDLCTLARVALDQGDRDAAAAASHQAVLHVRGRPRTLGGGFWLCRALACQGAVEEAEQLLRERGSLDWSWLWGATGEEVRRDLARARV